MDFTEADEFNEVRGFTDWAAMTVAQKAQAMAFANDYIQQTYRIKAELSDEDENRLSAARYLLARELYRAPESLRAAVAVKKESKEGAGFKKETEFFEASSSDPFPRITSLLAPIVVTASTGGFVIGAVIP